MTRQLATAQEIADAVARWELIDSGLAADILAASTDSPLDQGLSDRLVARNRDAARRAEWLRKAGMAE